MYSQHKGVRKWNSDQIYAELSGPAQQSWSVGVQPVQCQELMWYQLQKQKARTLHWHHDVVFKVQDEKTAQLAHLCHSST